MTEGMTYLLVGAVVAVSLLVALGAVRSGLPVLVGFLLLGMTLGSGGPGGIAFDDAALTRRVGTLGLALILYDGGLQTSWRRLRQVAVPAALLSTVGVFVTALGTGLAVHLLFGLSWIESFLLGAVVASTDAAAVFAAIRTSQIPTRLARTLEAESGGNDPMAIALTLGLIAWTARAGDYGVVDLALLVLRQLGVGLLAGAVLGMVASLAFAHFPHAIAAFLPVASIAVVALSFGVADVLGGSGFLAVYLSGLAVGSARSPYRRQLVAFHEGLAFLSQVGLFILLGLLVFPDQLPRVAGRGLALTLILVFLVRPLAVWISTATSSYSARERHLLGWAGLRGAAPIVLATFAISAHEPHANTIFNVVFFVVTISTVLQGTTLAPVARKLGLFSGRPPGHGSRAEGDASERARDPRVRGGAEGSRRRSHLRDLDLPASCVVARIGRGAAVTPPRGDAVSGAGDRLAVLA